MRRLAQALCRIGIIIAIAIAFLIGLASTVYLSLRSPEVQVPDVVGKDRWEGESALTSAGLNMRQRTTRYNAEAKPDTILDQLPRAGETIKQGQTVAVVVSRATAREGEVVSSESPPQNRAEANQQSSNQNKNNNGETARAADSNADRGEDRRSRNASAKNTNTRSAGNRNSNANSNANANRNLNANRNVNASVSNRNINASNRNAAPNVNRNSNASNTNRRPAVSTPPFNPGANRPRP